MAKIVIFSSYTVLTSANVSLTYAVAHRVFFLLALIIFNAMHTVTRDSAFIDIFLKLFEITSESIFFLQGIIQETNISQVKVKIKVKKIIRSFT